MQREETRFAGTTQQRSQSRRKRSSSRSQRQRGGEELQGRWERIGREEENGQASVVCYHGWWGEVSAGSTLTFICGLDNLSFAFLGRCRLFGGSEMAGELLPPFSGHLTSFVAKGTAALKALLPEIRLQKLLFSGDLFEHKTSSSTSFPQPPLAMNARCNVADRLRPLLCWQW